MHSTVERVCLKCGITFLASPCFARNGGAKYCTLACAVAARRGKGAKAKLELARARSEQITVDGEICWRIPLTKGQFALISAEDFEFIHQHSWHFTSNGYAARGYMGDDGKNHAVVMHRAIALNAGIISPSTRDTDHKNRDRLDNRRCNLRAATRSENNQNRTGPTQRSATGVRGVTFDKARNRYAAQLAIDGKHYHLGRYKTIEEAGVVVADARRRLMPRAPENHPSA